MDEAVAATDSGVCILTKSLAQELSVANEYRKGMHFMLEKKFGLPGLRSLDHFGFTVPNLEQARQFLVEVMGCEYMYTLGPFKHDDDWMQEHLNVHPQAVMEQLHFFKVGGTAILEVFQYSAPDQREIQPRNSDIGGSHIAFYVEDIDVAVQYLRENNVQVLGEISTSKNASEGQRWIYFLAPWGMQFELVSYPHGKAWEKRTAVTVDQLPTQL